MDLILAKILQDYKFEGAKLKHSVKKIVEHLKPEVPLTKEQDEPIIPATKL